MKKVSLSLVCVLSISMLVSCSPLESNYNDYEQKIVENQSQDKIQNSDYSDSFYAHNEIRIDQALAMKERNYLVYYHHGGDSDKEKKFESILSKYIDDEDSFKLYLVDLDTCTDTVGFSGMTRLVFISRNDTLYEVVQIWYDPDDIEKLPFKVRG